ncbi:hypothetical protein M433DRAFT_279719 [Acidomyces richmondensis BFW]|nr:MAG: hypothetical protein FE78DRAFT_435801 [Acidomyces sp. 'richmondensis']KYG44882.1 hypothetical protein M433DRAFT_279719 [Acidomyces richmondensis BFW]
MRNAIIAFAVAGLAAAQTSTSSVAATGTSATVSAASATSTSGCGTQVDAIIASCLGTENAQLQACAANDWDCLCTQSTNVLTCYNNCPSDPNAFAAQQQNTAYCNAAKAYGSTSSSATASATLEMLHSARAMKMILECPALHLKP